MPYCYYTCNLLPVAFLARAGYEPRWLGTHPTVKESAGRFDSPNVHPMTCPFVTRLVTAAERMLADGSADDRVVVPGGCDAMRRAGDLLSAQYPGQVRTFRLPRFADDGALSELTRDLEILDGWLRGSEERPLENLDARNPKAGSQEARRGFDLPSRPLPGGVFVVGGPLSDDSLLEFISKLGSPLSGVESCTAPARWLALDGPRGSTADSFTGAEEALSGDAVFEETARLILAQAVCPRRSSADRRAHLARRMREAQPSSVIYARQSFCDPGAYDALLAADLAREAGLPFLEIEVGFPLEVSGPLRTRIEAFLEAQLLDEDLLGQEERSEERGRCGDLDELDDLLSDDLPDEHLFSHAPPDDELFEDELRAAPIDQDRRAGQEG
jgi:hypothetical protein